MSVRRFDITLLFILLGANCVVYAALFPKDERISLMYCKIAYKTSSSLHPSHPLSLTFFLFYPAFPPKRRPSHIREWLHAGVTRARRAAHTCAKPMFEERDVYFYIASHQSVCDVKRGKKLIQPVVPKASSMGFLYNIVKGCSRHAKKKKIVRCGQKRWKLVAA